MAMPASAFVSSLRLSNVDYTILYTVCSLNDNSPPFGTSQTVIIALPDNEPSEGYIVRIRSRYPSLHILQVHPTSGMATWPEVWF